MKPKDPIDFPVDPLWKVSEVKTLIEKHRVIVPTPKIQTIHNWIQEGTLKGFQQHGEGGRSPWLVRESSLLAWIKSLQEKQ